MALSQMGPRPDLDHQSVIGRTSATDQIRPYTATSCRDGEQERFADGLSGGERHSEVAPFRFLYAVSALPSLLSRRSGARDGAVGRELDART